MKPESYFVELKQYWNVPLIVDYQIEEIIYEFYNIKIKTNKWVDFTVWLKIQEKLEELLKGNLVNFVNEEVLLSNNSISVFFVKYALEVKYAKIFDYRENEIQPFIIRINITQNKNTVHVRNVLKEYIHPRAEIAIHQLDANGDDNCGNGSLANVGVTVSETSDIISTVEDAESEKCTNEYNPLSPRTKSPKTMDTIHKTAIVNKTGSELRTNEYNPLNPKTVSNARSSKSSTNNTALISNEKDFVPYKPSSQIETSEKNILEKDPYSPKPVDLTSNNCSQESSVESPDLFPELDTSNIIPKYKASPILNKVAKVEITPEIEIVRKKSLRSTQQKKNYIEQYRETRNKTRAISPTKESITNSTNDETKKTTSNLIPKYKASPILNKAANSYNSRMIETSSGTETVKKNSLRSPIQLVLKNIIDTKEKRETRNKRRAKSPIQKFVTNSKNGEKKKILKKLFDSDDSEDDDYADDTDFKLKTIKKSKTDSPKIKSNKCNIVETNDLCKLNREQLKIVRLDDDGEKHRDKWLNSKKISSHKNQNKTKSTHSKLSKTIKDTTSPKTLVTDLLYPIPVKLKKLTEEERRLNVEKQEMEISALNELNNHVERLIKPLSNIDFKTLNHIPTDEILKTFNQYKPLLDKHFHEYNSQKHRHVKIIQGLDHLALINIIGENQQIKMLGCLKDNYELSNVVPYYTELFMTLILPEWILALFMNEYKLTRENAIKRLKDQEDAKVFSQLELDNSTYDF